jgi:hypothetical protein
VSHPVACGERDIHQGGVFRDGEGGESGDEEMRMGYIILSICMLALLACAPTKVRIYPKETQREKTSPAKPSPEKTPPERVDTVRPFAGKTYAETISEWKSHQDLVKWMERDFSLDVERYKRF